MPVVVEKPRQATGAIYNGRHSDNFFGRSRNYRVGDLITVMLDESTRAGREQKGSVSRDAENNVIPSGLVSKVQNLALPTKILGTTLGGVLNGINLNESSIKSSGVGTAGQSASLTGAVSVTVVEVLANGNLMVRGEKQLALTEGATMCRPTTWCSLAAWPMPKLLTVARATWRLWQRRAGAPKPCSRSGLFEPLTPQETPHENHPLCPFVAARPERQRLG
jgi:hypothetical protein